VTHPDGIELLPLYFMGNPRARGLVGKDLLKEVKWYRAHAETLATYAGLAHHAVTYADQGFSWPEKPYLPHLGQLATSSDHLVESRPNNPSPNLNHRRGDFNLGRAIRYIVSLVSLAN
jgi:hypothetical protein